MRLTPELFRKGSSRRQYERSYIVPFQAQLPLSIRNRVSNKSFNNKGRPCVPELTVLLQCFKDSDFNDVRCAEATKKFYACMAQFNETQTQLQSENRKISDIQDVRDLTPQDINTFLKKNPQL